MCMKGHRCLALRLVTDGTVRSVARGGGKRPCPPVTSRASATRHPRCSSQWAHTNEERFEP